MGMSEELFVVDDASEGNSFYVFDTGQTADKNAVIFELRNSGELVVAIKASGDIELNKPPDESAMVFWDTLKKLVRNQPFR
jgi:hypothetical protein